MLSTLCPGEANQNKNSDLYNCTFPGMIDDWRKVFHEGSAGETEILFPFGFVQVFRGLKLFAELTFLFIFHIRIVFYI